VSVLNKSFRVRYSGDSHFVSAQSNAVLINRATLKGPKGPDKVARATASKSARRG
jgi:hypothetical protein